MRSEMQPSISIGDQKIAKPEGREGLFQSAYALISPGQGDPLGIVRIAVDLSKHYGVANKIMEDARRNVGFSLIDLDEEDLVKRTKNAQPAIYLSTLMTWEVFKEEFGDVLPKFVVGYSLGDFASAAVAGVYDPMDGLEVVRERGVGYQECSDEFPTGMISVLGSTMDQREELFEKFPRMVVCLVNSAGDNISIGGPLGELNDVTDFLTEMKVKTLPNPARGAFHSRYYAKAKEKVRKAMSKIRIHDATKAAFVTRKGRSIVDGKSIVAELIDQTDTPFDWDTKSKFLNKRRMNHVVELAQNTVSKMTLRRFGGKIEPITAKLGKFIASRWKLNPQPAS